MWTFECTPIFSSYSSSPKSIQQLFQTQTNLTGNRTQDHLSSNQSTDKIVATASLGRPTVSRTITFIPRNIKSSRITTSCNNPCLQTQEKLFEKPSWSLSESLTIVTRPAWGIPAAPMLAAVAVIAVAITCSIFHLMSRTTVEWLRTGNKIHWQQFDWFQRECNLSKTQLNVVQLGNEDGGNSFIETGAIHVDNCANRENKPGLIKVNWNPARPKDKNLATCWLTLFFFSMQLMVTGRVAELEPVPKAVIKALKVWMMSKKARQS